MRERLRPMQKAKRKAESSSHALESTAFIHVEKKGTAMKDGTKRKNNKPLREIPLPLTFPYKLKL